MSGIGTADLLAQVVAGDMTGLRTLLSSADASSMGDLPRMPDGVTPMMIAAACGHEDVIELLLQCGADPTLRDAYGQSAAAYARAACHPHLAERLDTVVDMEQRI